MLRRPNQFVAMGVCQFGAIQSFPVNKTLPTLPCSVLPHWAYHRLACSHGEWALALPKLDCGWPGRQCLGTSPHLVRGHCSAKSSTLNDQGAGADYSASTTRRKGPAVTNLSAECGDNTQSTQLLGFVVLINSYWPLYTNHASEVSTEGSIKNPCLGTVRWGMFLILATSA